MISITEDLACDNQLFGLEDQPHMAYNYLIILSSRRTDNQVNLNSCGLNSQFINICWLCLVVQDLFRLLIVEIQIYKFKP